MSQPATAMVDPRQPRLGQALTGAALLAGFVLDLPVILPIAAVILAAASLLGPRFNLYAILFRSLRRRGLLGAPTELEEAAPPRFANTVGFVFLTAATLGWFALEAYWLTWTLALLVAALALLAAVTGLCVGCELYVVARRIATRGRIRGRLTAPPGRAGAA